MEPSNAKAFPRQFRAGRILAYPPVRSSAFSRNTAIQTTKYTKYTNRDKSRQAIRTTNTRRREVETSQSCQKGALNADEPQRHGDTARHSRNPMQTNFNAEIAELAKDCREEKALRNSASLSVLCVKKNLCKLRILSWIVVQRKDKCFPVCSVPRCLCGGPAFRVFRVFRGFSVAGLLLKAELRTACVRLHGSAFKMRA
jgi:hypothetical protein